MVDPEKAVEVRNPHPSRHEQCAGENLKQELAPVADSDKIVGNTYKIHQHQTAKQEEDWNHLHHKRLAQRQLLRSEIESYDHAEREYYGGEESDAAKTRYNPPVYLALIDFIE